MKKLIANILIVLSLSFNTANVQTQNTIPPLTEGVYNVKDFSVPSSEFHYVQNTSKTDVSYFITFNQDETIMQAIRLVPNSNKYELYPLDPSYRIVIIGKGSILLS